MLDAAVELEAEDEGLTVELELVAGFTGTTDVVLDEDDDGFVALLDGLDCEPARTLVEEPFTMIVVVPAGCELDVGLTAVLVL